MHDDDYHVIRIENNPLLATVEGTFQLDVLEWVDWIDSIPSVDVLLMSPPCTEFSTAYAAPRGVAQRLGQAYAPNMEIVNACLEIKNHLKPEFWILENVSGATTYFKDKPGLKNWQQKLGPYRFWGRFPYLALNEKDLPPSTKNCSSHHDPLGPNKRAKIPLIISQEIRNSYEQQRCLNDY